MGKRAPSPLTRYRVLYDTAGGVLWADHMGRSTYITEGGTLVILDTDRLTATIGGDPVVQYANGKWISVTPLT